MNPPLIVYVDVDDTLVRSAGTKRIPIRPVIEHIRQLHRSGAILYCWSTGGAEYARSSAEEFEVAGCFSAFLPKPNVLIDDQKLCDWRLCVELHPLNVWNKSVDEYWDEIHARK